MTLDLDQFFDACEPSKTLDLSDPADRLYYIDCASVRGGKIIDSLRRTIVRLSRHKPTCQLFTGHIGCGKSTELSRLKTELEDDGYCVIYFASTEDLDVADLDVTDILLAIARRVTQSLEAANIRLEPTGFKAFVSGVLQLLQTSVDVKVETELMGAKLEGSSEGKLEVSLLVGIGKITATTRNSQQQRSRLRQHLEPQTSRILDLINTEVLEAATVQLQQRGQKGLVVIVDNLDRVEDRQLPNSKRMLPEYLFIDRGEQLRKLNCHLVYTIPLSLIFSNDCETMRNRLGGGLDPKVLPMVPAQTRDGEDCAEGMALLRQIVLSRAFPHLKPQERLERVREIFETGDLLDRLCRVSGGHVRNLLGMLYGCLQVQDPPFSSTVLAGVIRRSRDRLLLAVDDREWDLLFQVARTQTVKGEEEYQTLLRSLFVFEYQDSRGCWFGLNPLLMETDRFQQWKNQ